jgi:hypothetical protein
MAETRALANHLARDCISLLEQAAKQRVQDATCLSEGGRRLAALYCLGYAVEMILTAAYFRSVGFGARSSIDRDTRHRHMIQARRTQGDDRRFLMSSDPHPLDGWARLLEWRRLQVKDVSNAVRERLKDATRRASIVYRHWRPELRYKVTDVNAAQLAEVRLATEWFIQHIGRL